MAQKNTLTKFREAWLDRFLKEKELEIDLYREMTYYVLPFLPVSGANQ